MKRPLWQTEMERLPTKRTCDGCDLCCTAVGVRELKKPPGVRCPKLRADLDAGHNCGVYPDHPSVCQEFACLWRMSDYTLPEGLHPPKVGFVLSMGPITNYPFVVTVHPDPARPTAWDTFYFRSVFARIARGLNCLLAVGQGRTATHIFTPVGKVYDKASRPDLFVNGGEQVGAPPGDFFSAADGSGRDRSAAVQW
jgi:hypothetical protein